VDLRTGVGFFSLSVEKRGTEAKVFSKRSTSLCSIQNAHISVDSSADPEKSKLQRVLDFERSLQFSNFPTP
jgi:hypothetical protein